MQTAEQEAYDFFTAAVEDHTWSDGDNTSLNGGEGGEGGREGGEEGGGREGEDGGRDEMDTSVLVEQQVSQLLVYPEVTPKITELCKIGIQVMQVKYTDSQI